MGAVQSFGQLLPSLTGTLGVAQSVLSTASAVQALANPDASADLALEQLQAQQALQATQLAQQTALEKEQIALETKQAEEDRVSALRRAVASQRATYGSSGVGSTGGSSEAVLLGLFEESEADRAQRAASDALKVKALDQEVAQYNSLNLLQATQLAEKQALNSLF